MSTTLNELVRDQILAEGPQICDEARRERYVRRYTESHAEHRAAGAHQRGATRGVDQHRRETLAMSYWIFYLLGRIDSKRSARPFMHWPVRWRDGYIDGLTA